MGMLEEKAATRRFLKYGLYIPEMLRAAVLSLTPLSGERLPGVSVAEVSGTTGAPKGMVTRMFRALRNDGLVTRRPSKGHYVYWRRRDDGYS